VIAEPPLEAGSSMTNVKFIVFFLGNETEVALTIFACPGFFTFAADASLTPTNETLRLTPSNTRPIRDNFLFMTSHFIWC
jgi:hypothetical protein